MTYMIIDNATIRGLLAALRMSDPTQKIPSKVLDVHIACAELVIEALLLSERIFVPQLHSEYPDLVGAIYERVGPVDSIARLSLPSKKIERMESEAEARIIEWSRRDPNFAETLKKYGEFSHSTNSWDVMIRRRYERTSAWLSFDTEERHFSEPYVKTAELKQEFPTAHSEDAASAILWLSSRTLIYDTLTADQGPSFSYSPHPLRSAFWKALQIRGASREAFFGMPVDILMNARLQVAQELTSAGITGYELSLPPFLAYVLQKARTPADILPVALDLREKRGVRSLRSNLDHLHRAVVEMDKVGTIRRKVRSFDKLSHRLAIEWGIESTPTITPSIQLVAARVQKEVHLPRSLTRTYNVASGIMRPRTAFLRDIFATTSRVWTLSSAFDRHFGDQELIRSTNAGRVSEIHIPKYRNEEDARRSEWGVDKVEDPNLSPSVDVRARLRHIFRTGHCCIAAIDVDDLDKWNETLGREGGDEIVRQAAMALRKTDPEMMTRIAGDTFVAIYDNPPDGLNERLKAELRKLRIEAGVEALRSRGVHRNCYPTASLGMADSEAEEFVDIDHMFATALEGLAASKAAKPPNLILASGRPALANGR
jgi:GGDEF domain-containing protein